MVDKNFLIECIDVLFLDEDENGKPIQISKQKHPVFEDSGGKYVEIYISDIGKIKHYLTDNELKSVVVE